MEVDGLLDFNKFNCILKICLSFRLTGGDCTSDIWY